jgi:hypothetical protein
MLAETWSQSCEGFNVYADLYKGNGRVARSETRGQTGEVYSKFLTSSFCLITSSSPQTYPPPPARTSAPSDSSNTNALRRMFVPRMRPEGEFQAGPLRSPDEILVGDMRHLINLDGNLAGARQLDDAVDAVRRPELRVLPRDGHGQERGPAEDIDGLGGQHLLDERHVVRHEFFAVVDHGVDLPDRKPSAAGPRQRERVIRT